MELIREVIIGPFRFGVEYQDGYVIEEGNLGACCEADHRITLSRAQDKRKQLSTLMHECVEAYNAKYNIELTHHQINLLELCWYDFMSSNPHVLDSFLELDSCT